MPARASDPTDVLVGRNVRARRIARGMTQTALGEGIGVSFQQVQKYEKGSNRIGGGRLVRIAHVLEVPVSSLFEGVKGHNGPADTQSPLRLIADPQRFRLVQAFAEIGDAGLRRSIVRLVDGLAGLNRCPEDGKTPRY